MCLSGTSTFSTDCYAEDNAVAHHWTLFDIQARFADVVSLEETLRYLETLGG